MHFFNFNFFNFLTRKEKKQCNFIYIYIIFKLVGIFAIFFNIYFDLVDGKVNIFCLLFVLFNSNPCFVESTYCKLK